MQDGLVTIPDGQGGHYICVVDSRFVERIPCIPYIEEDRKQFLKNIQAIQGERSMTYMPMYGASGLTDPVRSVLRYTLIGVDMAYRVTGPDTCELIPRESPVTMTPPNPMIDRLPKLAGQHTVTGEESIQRFPYNFPERAATVEHMRMQFKDRMDTYANLVKLCEAEEIERQMKMMAEVSQPFAQASTV